MKVRPLPSQERLHALFDLDEATGVLTWRYRPETLKEWNTRFAGKPVGCVSQRGYIKLRLEGACYLAHRIIFKMMTGLEPEEIDHLDCDPGNNAPANLRAATRRDNECNKRARVDNKSGLKGVSIDPKTGRWRARIQIDGRRRTLGLYGSASEASRAYQTAALATFGDFARWL